MPNKATELCDDFTDLWPSSAFGPAHIVLDDLNLDNNSISGCIEQIRLELQSPTLYHTEEELRATESFLLSLLLIPEDERVCDD